MGALEAQAWVHWRHKHGCMVHASQQRRVHVARHSLTLCTPHANKQDVLTQIEDATLADAARALKVHVRSSKGRVHRFI